MKNLMKSFTLVALSLVLAACGQKGDEFVGKWQAKNSAEHQIVIEINGESLLLRITEPPSKYRKNATTIVVPAVYKDGTLEMTGGFGSMRIGYVKDTDTLLVPSMGGSQEYRRVK